MNREIKFRGRNARHGWLTGHYFVNRDVYFIVEDGIADPLNTWEDYAVDPDTVGQYTGLKDRNGKEIFEGDILLLSDKDTHQELAVVEHGLYGWTFYNPKTVLRYEDGSHTYRAVENYRFMFGTGEIIGNIHDNPELLEDME